MTLNSMSFISGISGLMIVSVGYLLAFYTAYLFMKSKSYQTLALTLTLFCTSSVWLGVTTNFLLYMVTGSESGFLTNMQYFLLISWPIGLLIPVTMFLTTSFIGEQYQKIAVGISVIVGFLWLIIAYVLVPFGYIELNLLFTVADYQTGTLPDSSFIGLTLLLTLLGLIIMAISGILFLATGRSSQERIAKLRGFYLGSGYLLFSITSLGDAMSDALGSEIFIIIVRILVILSFVLVSIAILKPNKIFKINADTSSPIAT